MDGEDPRQRPTGRKIDQSTQPGPGCLPKRHTHVGWNDIRTAVVMVGAVVAVAVGVVVVGVVVVMVLMVLMVLIVLLVVVVVVVVAVAAAAVAMQNR